MLPSGLKERLRGSYSQSFLIIFFIEGLSNFIRSGLYKSSSQQYVEDDYKQFPIENKFLA
jgi:hypothetical protein